MSAAPQSRLAKPFWNPTERRLRAFWRILLTLGGLGIWTLIDFIIIVTGSFKDGDGLTIKAGH